MIRSYFHPTPNPAKVALFLEEAGLPYEVIGMDHGFKKVNDEETKRALFPSNYPPV